MIPNTDSKMRVIQSSAGFNSQQMGVDLDSINHLMGVLTNLYKDPALAVIREYSTNAHDSHVAAGKADVPIHITLPTNESPEFVVRDQGVGLSEEEVFGVFGMYGKSTKRKSNAYTGQLGLGCKSALTYASQFVLTATKDGVRGVYSIHLNDQNLPTITQLSSNPTDEGNGVTVTVPVSDVSTFNHQAKRFYQYFPYANVSTPLTTLITINEHAIITDLHNSCVVMGGVPYPIESELKGLVVYAEMGEVDFTPSREELQYSPRTLRFLKEKVEPLRDLLRTRVKDLVAAAPNIREAHAALVEQREVCGVVFFSGEKIDYRGIPLDTYYNIKYITWPPGTKLLPDEGRTSYGADNIDLVFHEYPKKLTPYTRNRLIDYGRARGRRVAVISDSKEAVDAYHREYGFPVYELDALRKMAPSRVKVSKITVWDGYGYREESATPTSGIVLSRAFIADNKKVAASILLPRYGKIYAVANSKQKAFGKKFPGVIIPPEDIKPWIVKELLNEDIQWTRFHPKAEAFRSMYSSLGFTQDQFSGDKDIQALIELSIPSGGYAEITREDRIYNTMRRFGYDGPLPGVDRLEELYDIVMSRYPLIWGMVSDNEEGKKAVQDYISERKNK